MRSSSQRVPVIAIAGGKSIAIGSGKPGDVPDADPKAALRTVEANALAVVGAPRRKPRHFEIPGRDNAGGFVEMHVEIDGTLRKSKPITPGDGNGRMR